MKPAIEDNFSNLSASWKPSTYQLNYWSPEQFYGFLAAPEVKTPLSSAPDLTQLEALVTPPDLSDSMSFSLDLKSKRLQYVATRFLKVDAPPTAHNLKTLRSLVINCASEFSHKTKLELVAIRDNCGSFVVLEFYSVKHAAIAKKAFERKAADVSVEFINDNINSSLCNTLLIDGLTPMYAMGETKLKVAS
jgi:hypothetical protein